MLLYRGSQEPYFHWLHWGRVGAGWPQMGGPAEPLPSRSAYEVDPEGCSLSDRFGGVRREKCILI